MTLMTLMIPAHPRDHFRASRIAVAMAFLGLLAALPARLEAQCTLSGSPVSFEPNPPGVSREGTPYLGSGFNNNLALYQNDGSGPYRLLMQESFGYSVLDLSNPVNPTALYYHDVRFPIGGRNSVTHHGDGQNNIQTIAVSPDGQRAAFSTTGPAAPFNTVVGSPDGGSGFTLWGDFNGQRASGTLIQHVGSRYIAYDILPNSATASDITTLPTSPLSALNMASETTSWPGGYLASIAGNYLLYQSGDAIRVIDASVPGPIGSITANYQQTTITSADFGGRTIAYYSAAVDPADATKLWVLVELEAAPGQRAPSYGLVSLTKGFAAPPLSAGSAIQIPWSPGDTFVNVGYASALIPSNGGLFVLMWTKRLLPTTEFRLYSTTAAAWASVPPGSFPVSGPGFALPTPTAGFADASSSAVYAYVSTTVSAYVIPMSCVSQNAPAVASMTVVNQAGAPLNNNDTVFLGDQVTITPSINPSPALQPLTRFGWNFDFDFHAGAASEDAGVGNWARLKAPDVFGSQASLPTPIPIVGPCDPQVGGTTPGSGTGCWTSVTTNGAFGGPDFTPPPSPGSSKALTFAFEANNALGSNGASLFTLNWKVPAAKLQSTQVLSAQLLVSGSDGHPTATGFKWYFGATPTTLTQASGCTGPTCLPTLDTKGTYYYWLTASYANGYVTADYDGTTNVGQPYTITDFAPAFTVNGATSGPITVVTNQNLTVLNSSQRGQTVTASGGYWYSLCSPAPCADNYILWPTMGDAPTSGTPPYSATIPIPATAGDYALKIRVNYTTGTAYWPDPAGTASFGLHVLDVQPLVVTASVNPSSAATNQQVTFSCNVSGGLAPYSYEWRSPISFIVGTQPTWQTTSSVAGNVQALCTVRDNQPTPAFSSDSATATFTGPPPPPPPPPPSGLSVSVSVYPNPATVNQTATFSCNVSGGSAPYTYQWRSPSTSTFIAGTSQTFQTSSPTPTSIQAGCTATDSAGASSGNTATLTINAPVAPPATCTDVNYSILDRDNGYISIPLSSGIFGQYFAVATGQNLVFQATGTGINGVDWTFGDPANGTGSGNPKWYTYATAGTFTATVTANSNAACTKSYRFIVAGPSGLFTARYADNSVFSSTHVESGKDLSFLATDIADSYAWNFGDGFTAAGKNPTHAFRVNASTNVTFTTTLTVTIGSLNWVTTQTFTVIPPPEPPKWFVAGLAYTPGAASGTVWQSDLTILNPDPTLSATYSLAFLDGKNPVAPKDLVWKPITLPAKQIFSASNVVSTFFGKPLGSYGAVIVRGDVAPVVPSITSRTYNNGDPGKGTFGLSVPATQATSGVSQQSSAAQQLLIGLRDDASADTNTGAYTNIGLVNLISTDWSHAHLTFFDAAGANLGVIPVDVPPYGVVQLTKPLTSGGGLANPPLALYRVQVTVDPGGAVYPYATVIDQASTDPIVVTPTEQPLNTYRVPGLVRLAGANNTVWRSRFTISNPSGGEARKVHMVFSYASCGANGCASRVSIMGDVTMNPGQTQSWDDFVKVWLTAKGDITVDDAKSYQDSFLDVSPGDANGDPLLVLGETYNSQPTGPVGLQLSGFTDLDGSSKTGAGKRLLLTGLASNTDFRTNVAFFLTSGTSGYFNVRVLSDTGVTLKTFGWNLSDSSPFKQFSDSDLFGGVNKSDRMSIIVDSFDGSSPVAAYATIIDNTSGDATFVKAQPAP
jgi:hypothetical protein